MIDPSDALLDNPAEEKLVEQAELQSEPLTNDQANWAMVKASLAAMSEAQALFFKEMRDARHIDGLFLVERFNGIDERVNKLASASDRVADAVETQNDLLEQLNRITSGLRNASDSNYDIAKSATKKIERVRRFLNVPDEVVNEPDPADSTEIGNSPANSAG
jgi:hypothetical protein